MSKMINVYRRYALAGATFSVAISIGFLMQSGEANSAGRLSQQPASGVTPDLGAATPARLPPEALPPLSDVQDLSALPMLPREIGPKADFPSQPVILTVSRDSPVGMMPEEETTPMLGCDVALLAEPEAGAMVRVSLSAPCLMGERVTLHHSDMRFTELVGADGMLTVSIPALTEQAVFIVAFANGEGAVASANVPSLPFYDRVVVQWKGPVGLQLHAREYEADYGSDGHVWRGASRDVSILANGQGGYLTRLGNTQTPDALMAEIYTFPSGTAPLQGHVRLSVEAEVDAVNCSKDVTAQSIQLRSDKPPKLQDFHLTLPDCDAVGEFLVLKNLLEDLTIAQN
ncbi:translocase [Shimia litoralis]|uniref:Translocase n=1 Tax=Shimia litoralis TaxID=420403 RepID=A0A4U7N139_9RHOB|nr:translocase [Shimia litoralis]TKZ19352.1 translocase [Shimia litoralis]